MKAKLDGYKKLDADILFALIDHFNYSIANINSYEELTRKEKDIISKETFNKMINGSKN